MSQHVSALPTRPHTPSTRSIPSAASNLPVPSVPPIPRTQPRRGSIHLGVDLSGTTARPAVWRTHGSRAARDFDRDTAVRLAQVAAHGALDFVAFGPDFTFGTSRDSTLGGVLDPAVAACRVVRNVPGVGVVAHLDPGTVEPAHVAQALAAVDEHTGGRAGWQVSRATVSQVREIQRAWDGITGAPALSDTEQRTTHDGVRFAVKGRPPGSRPGQSRIPVVVALSSGEQADRTAHASSPDAASALAPSAHALPADDGVSRTSRLELAALSADDGVSRTSQLELAALSADDGASRTSQLELAGQFADDGESRASQLELAGQVADVVRIRAAELDEAVTLRTEVRAAAVAAGRDPDDVRVLVDLFAVIGPDDGSAAARLDLLRRMEDEVVDEGSLVTAGSPVQLAVTIQDWVDAGAADGFVVRPAALATDLDAFVAAVVPVLQGSGYLRPGYPGTTLGSTLALAKSRQHAVVGT